ncbi:MAG: NADH-ubiquinone oxidoreductase-F iron-sulfur binding region domain-containing protein, partial [Methyloligellaceae bacterium]
FLAAAELHALAEEMKLPMSEVYEVASFYAHFDIVLDGEAPPPPITVRVCDSLSCELAGAQDLIADLEAKSDSGEIRILRAPCMGRCQCAPVAEVGHRHIEKASAKSVLDVADLDDLHPEIPDYIDLQNYRASGGYRILKRCFDRELSELDVINLLSSAGLRGLGGAGFPAGKKWEFVRAEPGPRLMTINGDEGEPGTFKDRHYLETDPHRMLEGALIAAWAVEAERCYIYMRDEYPAVLEILEREIEKLNGSELTAHCKFELRRGAGAYICGEESAMIESIEGKRGLPRHRPPYIAQNGLFGRPTLNHNVETLHWIRDILDNGAEWFSDQGKSGHPGFRSYSVSGRVNDPGVKVAPAGITVRELIDTHCGGMLEGHKLKAYLPGGASGGILPARLDNLPLDFGSLEAHGCFIGSHAVVILSDQDNIRDVTLNLMRFFEDESCGQCTPCRNGTEKAVKLLSDGCDDASLLSDLSEVMEQASICGLGQAAPNPLRCLLKYFPEELT